MLKNTAVIMLMSGAVLVSGCGPKTPAPTIHEGMTQVMQPQADIIWSITNNAFNDFGDALDPAKISAEDWKRLEAAGQRLGDEARRLAEAKEHVVAAPGVKLEAEGAPGAASARQVQAHVDRDPDGFAQRSLDLAKSADAVVKAAQTKDIDTLFHTANGLDQVCDACHERYWIE